MKTFKEIMKKEEGTTMIADALNIAFRFKHSGKEVFAEDYVELILSLATSYKASKVIIAADSGTSKFRLAIHPEYKLTRKQSFAEQTEEERESFARFFDEFERALRLCEEKFCVLRFDGVEADDIAAYVVENRQIMGIEYIWLISSDKDWNLLLNKNVSQFSTVTRQEITIDNFEQIRGADDPDFYLSMKVLMGESGKTSDNVPGVPQVGPTRAAQLIRQYGSALDIYTQLPLPGKYKFIQNINNSGDLILKNYKLFDLRTYCHEAIGVDNVVLLHKLWDKYNE